MQQCRHTAARRHTRRRRREKTGLRRQPVRRGPVGDLRAVEQHPVTIRREGQPLVSDPAFHDFFRYAKRLGDLDDVQIH
jgi:hypothetical protein